MTEFFLVEARGVASPRLTLAAERTCSRGGCEGVGMVTGRQVSGASGRSRGLELPFLRQKSREGRGKRVGSGEDGDRHSVCVRAQPEAAAGGRWGCGGADGRWGMRWTSAESSGLEHKTETSRHGDKR